jgi:hypothetical protein
MSGMLPRMGRCPAIFGLWLAGSLACSGDSSAGDATSATSSGTIEGTSAGTSGGSTSGTSSGSSGSAGESSGSTGESSGGVELCGDGVHSPGELCFLRPSLLPIGPDPLAMAVGDLDHDGANDLAFALFSPRQIVLRFGDGVGGFSGPTILEAVSQPRDLAIVDLDGLSGLDVVMVELGFGYLVRYRSGAAPRSFESGAQGAGGARPRAIASGDLDGDGDQDLAIADEEGGIFFAFGDGAGGIASVSALAIEGEPYDVALGDLDGDGDLDVVAPLREMGALAVVIGDGVGGFAVAELMPLRPDPRALALTDLDGDGDLDVAVVSFEDDFLVLAQGTGAGTFEPFSALPLGRGLYGVAAAQLDAQGWVDLVVISRERASAIVVAELDQVVPRTLEIGLGLGVVDVVIADLSGDGALDLAVADSLAGGVHLIYADP